MRIQNARLLNKNLHGNGRLKIPEANPDGRCVYLRFPILFENRETWENAFLQLHRKRLGASHSYPTPLSQIAGFKKYMVGDGNLSGAQFVSDRILTLPTHPYIREDDIQRITSPLESVTI